MTARHPASEPPHLPARDAASAAPASRRTRLVAAGCGGLTGAGLLAAPSLLVAWRRSRPLDPDNPMAGEWDALNAVLWTGAIALGILVVGVPLFAAARRGGAQRALGAAVLLGALAVFVVLAWSAVLGPLLAELLWG